MEVFEGRLDRHISLLFVFTSYLSLANPLPIPSYQLSSHNGHMIKFQFFEKSSSLNCHFKNLGTFVVSIAHYMRAYFNYQALTHGNDFELPGDVGFLNVSCCCVGSVWGVSVGCCVLGVGGSMTISKFTFNVLLTSHVIYSHSA